MVFNFHLLHGKVAVPNGGIALLPQLTTWYELAQQFMLLHAGSVGKHFAAALRVRATAQLGGGRALALHVFNEIERVNFGATVAANGKRGGEFEPLGDA